MCSALRFLAERATQHAPSGISRQVCTHHMEWNMQSHMRSISTRIIPTTFVCISCILYYSKQILHRSKYLPYHLLEYVHSLGPHTHARCMHPVCCQLKASSSTTSVPSWPMPRARPAPFQSLPRNLHGRSRRGRGVADERTPPPTSSIIIYISKLQKHNTADAFPWKLMHASYMSFIS